mgnify:CR=1 FL=1
MINSKCMADELHVKYSEQQSKQMVLKCEREPAERLGSCCVNIGYSTELEGSICRSMAKEFKMKQRNVVPIMMLQANTSLSNGQLADEWHEQEITAGERLEAWDDLTGLPLDPKGVLEARRKELEYVDQKKVWDIVSREKARANGWGIIETKWIDIKAMILRCCIEVDSSEKSLRTRESTGYSLGHPHSKL